jgi:hypothetical protein
MEREQNPLTHDIDASHTASVLLPSGLVSWHEYTEPAAVQGPVMVLPTIHE